MKTSFWLRILAGITCILLISSIVLSFTLDAYSFYKGPGNSVSISPDDSDIAFSYHENGNTYIYTGNPDGTNIERLTDRKANEENPSYSRDGREILFLSETNDRIFSLFTKKRNNKEAEPKRLTNDQLHVRDAVFSADSSTIYFLGINAEDWMAEEGEGNGGFDLYALDRETENVEKLTEQDYMLMSSLSVSLSGGYLLFNALEDGEEKVLTHSLNQNVDVPTSYQQFPAGIYGPVLSPDGEQIAYSTMSDLSTNDTYEYELFLFHNESGQSERLTTAKSNVESPAFFHEKSEMLFLEDHNWPNEPTNYSLVSIDLANQETTTINLEMPHPQNQLIGSAANALTHHYTNVGLYVLLGGLTVFHFRHKPVGAYFPAIISVLLTAAAYLMSLFFNWTYQTITMALGPLIIELAVCSILFCLFAFYLQRHRY